MTAPPRVLVVDSSVLINLAHVDRLGLLGRLPGIHCMVPEDVVAEITHPTQAAAVAEAVTRGDLVRTTITDPASIGLYAELRTHLGRGEAACVAMAIEHGWSVACDEKGRCRREAEDRLGRQRVVGTRELYVAAIRAGALTVEEADGDKALLEQRRFIMPFGSFREVTGPAAQAEEAGP